MSHASRSVSRRDALRAGAGVVAAATVSQPASAQDDPYDGWFDSTSNYDGTVDRSGQETVTVTVGAGEQGILFDPPAIQIDPGTTVVWEWTGEGGNHNVVEENGVFESELVGETGYTFEYTFTEDNEGEIFRYYCRPHQTLGMVGAVAVGDVVETTAAEGAEESSGGSENGSGESGGGSENGSGGDSGTPVGPLSTEGIVSVFGGVLALGLLSPLLFALVMKFVYEDDTPSQEPDHHRL